MGNSAFREFRTAQARLKIDSLTDMRITSRVELAVYAQLIDDVDIDPESRFYGYAWRSIPGIAKKLQKGERTVRKAIDHLEEIGLIHITRRRGRHTWSLIVPVGLSVPEKNRHDDACFEHENRHDHSEITGTIIPENRHDRATESLLEDSHKDEAIAVAGDGVLKEGDEGAPSVPDEELDRMVDTAFAEEGREHPTRKQRRIAREVIHRWVREKGADFDRHVLGAIRKKRGRWRPGCFAGYEPVIAEVIEESRPRVFDLDAIERLAFPESGPSWLYEEYTQEEIRAAREKNFHEHGIWNDAWGPSPDGGQAHAA